MLQWIGRLAVRTIKKRELSSMVKKVYTKNADYQKFEVLKTNRNKRYRYGEFLVEGVRNINNAVARGWKIVALLYPGERSLSGWAKDLLETVKSQVNYELSPELMDQLSGKEEPSELMAMIAMAPPVKLGDFVDALPDNPVLALFDRPSNRGNLGTIIRSCDALGVEALVLIGHGVDPYDPEVVGATMGSFFKRPPLHLPKREDLEELIKLLRGRYKDFQTIGTTAHAELTIEKINLKRPTFLYLGNETDGLSHYLKERSDFLAAIPMASTSEASSLNVACAATVLFYEAARQRDCN